MDPAALAEQAAMQGNMSSQAAREVSVVLSANTGQFQGEMKKAAGAIELLADGITRVDEAYKKALKTIGVGMIGMGASMQGTATGGIFSAVAFEEQFARVAKTTGLQNELQYETGPGADTAAAYGIGDNELQQFENDIRALSRDMPVAIGELSHLADVAGTLGVESENLTLFSETAAQLGAGINELSSDQAIAGLSNLIGAFGLAEEQVTNLGSSLADLANHTRGNAADMLQFADRMAGTAVQVGMAAEEVLGFGAAVSAIGVMPELGASAVTQVIQQLSRAVQTGGEELTKFAQVLDMSGEELKTLWSEEGATATLVRFVEQLSAQGEGASVTLERLGLSGVNVTQVFGGLAAQSDVLNDAMAKSNKAFSDGTAVSELAAVRFDTVTKSLQQFRQATTEVFRGMGQGFLKQIQAMIDSGTALVNVFNNLPQAVKSVIGVFAGLGGAAMSAAGTFTLFFAQFHGFFMIVTSLLAIMPALSAKLVTMGVMGEAAAAHMEKLNIMLGKMVLMFTDGKGSMLSFTAIIRNVAVATRDKLAVALAFATKQLARFSKWVVGFTMQHIAEAFVLTNKAAGKFTSRLAMAAPALLKFAGIAGVAGAAIWYLVDGKESWAEATQEATSELDSMNDTLGLVSKNFRDVDFTLADSFGVDSETFKDEAAGIISELQAMEDASAKNFLLRYRMERVGSGNDPDEVQRHIEELARLANKKIVFEWDLEDARSGEGFDELQEAMQSAFTDAGRMYTPQDEGMFSKVFNYARGTATPRQEAAIDDALDQVFARAQDMDLPGLIGLHDDALESVNEAKEKGVINSRMARYAEDQLTELLPDRLAQDDRSFSERLPSFDSPKDVLDALIPSMGVDPFSRENTLSNDLRFSDPQEAVAQAFGPNGTQNIQHIDKVGEAVRRVTQESGDLDDVIRGMSPEEFTEFTDELDKMQQELWAVQDAAAEANIEFDTMLGKALSDSKMQGDAASQRRYIENFIESMPQRVGYEEALEQANTELRNLSLAGEEWGEDAERLRKITKEWGEEFAKIKVRDISQDLNAETATERVRALHTELLKIQHEPWAAQVTLEVREVQMETYQRAVDEFRQGMQRYDSLLEQREDVVEDHNRRMEDMEENHNRRLGDMREGRDKAIADANENHKDRLEDINKAEKKALEERVEQQAKSFNILERVQATPTASLGAVLDNMQAQNDAMSEMNAGVKELERLGLSTDVMEELGFNDPKNFAQVRRMLEMAYADPAMIQQINKEWEKRLDLSKAFVEEGQGASDIRERFDEQREAANENLDKQIEGINERYQDQLADANENYSRQVDNANENHQRQLADIAESLGELSENSLESIDELIEKASESGLEKLEEWANKITEIRELVEQGPEAKQGSPAWIDQQWGIDYNTEPFKDASEDAADEILVGWRNNAPVTWRELQRDIARGTGEAFEPLSENVEMAVLLGYTELARFTDQNHIWSPAQRETETGARGIVTGLTRELEAGTSQVDRIMGGWVGSIEDNLNPVLESIGEDPLDINVRGSSRRSGQSQPGTARAMAQGGFLPDQATIQSPGTLVQWAEPETGGEAFIPLASSKRERSKAIWEKTGEMLGIDMSRLDPHALHSYAQGGFHNIPDMSDLGAIGEATEKAMEYVYKMWMQSSQTASSYDQRLGPGGDAGAASGNWRSMWNVLKEAFPTANLHSGYRPGAITATGNPSYHGMGRAIDITPSVDIANWIRRHFMEQTREMIYSPMNSKQIHNGSDHYYATPITRAQHWDHVHWAMAQGGQLTDKMKKGGDNVPAWLSDGEFVMQAEAVKQYGLEMMEALNAKKFSSGGAVGEMLRTKGREPAGGGTDLVNALTKALQNAELARSETNNWDVKVEANDTRSMIKELERKKRLSRLTGSGGETNR